MADCITYLANRQAFDSSASMAVQLVQRTMYVAVHDGKQVNLPESLVHEDQWFQLRPSNYNVCVLFKATDGKNSNCHDHPGVQRLRELRNEACKLNPKPRARQVLQDEDGDEDADGEQPARKKQKTAMHSKADKMAVPDEINVETTEGTLVLKKASKTSEDVFIKLTEENLRNTVKYVLKHAEAEHLKPPKGKRSYVKSGKFVSSKTDGN